MDNTLDFALTAIAVIIGILMLTGHGSIFMKGGPQQDRKKLYDEKKVERGTGVALILLGIITGISAYTTSFAAKIAYVVAILVIFLALVYYMRTKCKLDDRK